MSSVSPDRLTCELEGSAWEAGSSDGAAPVPMGLSVVIRLGWPRRVRVMVVGTFKPERHRMVGFFCPSLHFPFLERPLTTHETPPDPASCYGLLPSWVI